MKKPLNYEEMDDGESLCKYCVCTQYGENMNAPQPNAFHSGCEGIYCNEAYEQYLEDFFEDFKENHKEEKPMVRYVFSKNKYLKYSGIKSHEMVKFKRSWVDKCVGIVFEAEEDFVNYITSNNYHVNSKWCTKLGKKNYPKNF